MTALAVALVACVAALVVVLVRARALRRELDERERAVTAARAAADALQERQRRLSLALDAIPQGVLVHDPTGALVHRNDGAAPYVSPRPRDALVGEAIREVADAAREGRSERRSVELFGPPARSVVQRGIPLGPDAGTMVVIDDVSERRRLESVRRDFVANISHELKTPVAALSLLAETLLSERDPEVVRRLAERLVGEAMRVGRTIDDLLELSRIEADAAPPAEAVPVEAVVREAVDRVSPAAAQRGIDILVEPVDRRLSVLGDPRQLVSALFNLLDNAVGYSDDRSTVEVRVATDGTWVELAVADHGIGIPRRDLERVFERFYRVDRARSRRTGGTGLGLAIVRHIAANHRGDVRVESREGEGSVFTLRLPAGPGPVALPADTA